MLVLLAAVTSCSDRSPVAPEHGRIPCRPSPALVAMVTLEPFAPATMRDALEHGADRMSLEILASQHRTDLQDAMRFAAADLAVNDLDGACRMVEIAESALAALPDSVASYADRDGIRLILALTAHSLDAVLGK